MINSNWNSKLESEFKKDYFKKLINFIDNEYELKTIFPKKEDIFNAFKYCNFENVKVVILGQDPYHNYNQAHGLAFSVLKGNKIPPSLKNIYKELTDDLGVPIPVHGDLTSWATEGVFLLNTILSVEAHLPLSHKGIGWEKFTDKVIELINNDDRPKVFVLLGNNAISKQYLITNKHHLVIKLSHPSPLSARHSFIGSKLFSKINDYLVETNQSVINYKIL